MSRIAYLVALALLVPAAAAGVDPAALLREVHDSRLDTDRAVEVGRLNLQAGLAELRIERGTFFPSSPVGGRVVEMVFVGEARLVIEPPDDVEAGQLELFTGNPRLDEPIQEAVLVVAIDAASEAIYNRPLAAVDAAAKGHAQELYDRWRARAERRLLGVETALLRDALADPFYQGYFAGWFRSEDLGEFLYLFEPDAPEQVTLGQFTPLDATEKEKRKLARALHKSQRRGRLLGLAVDDLGQWDTWVSSSLRRPDGEAAAGRQPFEPELYELDVELSEPDLELRGRARIHLRALSNAALIVELEVHSDLKIEHARLQGETSELFFHQAGTEVVVLLAAAPAPDVPLVLELEYSGHVIEKGVSNTYLLSHTTNWYPHTGSVDLARYDVTFHWPAKLDLVAGGARVDGGEEAGGRRRFERRRLDHPTFGFSFEVGRFKTLTDRAGHVDVTLSLDPLIYSVLPKEGREEILSTVVDALGFFEESFGPFPLDELALVTAPRDFSQSFLGFVTLSTLNMTETDWWSVYLGLEDRRTVIAHELAHQWWGHLVAWESYRDQWISEAMANYAAVLYARNRLVGKTSVLIGPTTGWQAALTSSTADGRPIESIGPLVLGERLVSSRSGAAYEAIVYKKGAVVLDMLSRHYREDAFLKVLRAMVEAVSFRAVSTATFIELIERISDQDLDGFAKQFIYGSGLPEVYYTYDFQPTPEGKWLVEGVARQESPYRHRYRVLEKDDGSFDVGRERLDQVDVAGSSLVVPVVIAVFNPASGASEVHKREKLDPKVSGNAYLTGHLLLRGQATDIRFESDFEPKELWLDKNSEVFGRFFNERRHPKRMLFYQGLDAAAAGDFDQAETLYRQALAAQTSSGPAYGRSDREGQKAEGRQLDARVHVQLARIHLDRDRLGEARAAFAEAEKLVTSASRYWLGNQLRTLEARLAIRSGDPERAYKLLRKAILRRGDLESAEGVLLLAIAARATGHTEDYEAALEMAREKDSDVSGLTGSV
ncbi:MAG TPA: M1 family aminopeptidase [Thermoanaerobaculia bacterium]